MKKQLFLGSITAFMLSSGLHANWDGVPYAEWDNNGYYGEYDQCSAESKLLIEAEFLYWTPGTYFPFANNTYTTPGAAVVSPNTPFPAVVDTINEPYVRISEKWSPGARVGLGWKSGESDWEIWGKWTGYSNYARRVINSTPPALVPGTFPAVATGALVPAIGSGFLEPAFPEDKSRAVEGPSGTSVTAAYKLNYNVADLVFAKELRPDCNLVLTPYAGVRASWIHQRQSAYFTGAALSANLVGSPTGTAPASTSFSEKVWGVGPRLGMGAAWGDWHGITLLGNISGAILYGHFKEYATTTVTTGGAAVGAITTTYAHTRDRYNLIMPNLQVQMGFGYKFDFNCDQDSIDIYALWEGNYYWGGSNVFLNERGLGLNGLTTGIAYNW